MGTRDEIAIKSLSSNDLLFSKIVSSLILLLLRIVCYSRSVFKIYFMFRSLNPLRLADLDYETTQNERNTNDATEATQIQEFYKDTNIFVTGATGFLGNILLEKLLRSCHNLSTIYILVRSKKGKTVNTRIEEIFDDVLFDRMKKINPKFQHKIVGIAGDCSLPDLGLSSQDRKTLIEETHIVFHVAATVRFDEKLKTAVDINVRATEYMLNLAHSMPKLKSFIHVSTAYANCTGDVIEEKIYPPAMDHKKLITMSDILSEKLLDTLTPTILDKYPNTYAFTKQIAEDVVKTHGENLPVGITRPSVVISTYKEPVKAWINNMYGCTGMVAGAGLGLIRTMYCDGNVNANVVPVDMCVNSMITAAWDVSEKFIEAKTQNKEYEIPVYNFESSNECAITWNEFMGTNLKYGVNVPSSRAIWYFCFSLQSNYFLYLLFRFFLHTVPAYIVDGALLCMGQKPKMYNVYRKIHKFSGVLSYFTKKTWIFKSNNVQRVCKKLSKRDNEIFFCDLSQINWDEYSKHFIRGIRIYLVNDPMETLPQAIVRWKRLYWAHQIVKTVCALLFLSFLWIVVNSILNFSF
ncbi:fatty acyl-CoA reductase wat-like isoform X1 [Diorhabda carinulata]|uniref:fatty acyl-CoA reductase wat-like isoform X1 n=1 Tax=Diorhabda carinulata TaxID=1163345 RepID=UPI0025A15B49|nr:fatty acyl-CoA reductase wat-like isoform X1 [Diorhabda carinulata]